MVASSHDGSYVKHNERLTCDRDRGRQRPESRGQARGPYPLSLPASPRPAISSHPA